MSPPSGHRHHRVPSHGLLAGLALLLAAPGAPAAERDPAAGAPAVQETKRDGVYVVDGTFQVEAPAEVVWAVLTDYDGIGRFVPSMRRSQVRERTAGRVLVEQLAVAKVLFLTREVQLLLALHEEPARRIAFHDISRKDFEVYRGGWTITEAGGRTEVAYHLEARPREGVPGFIGHSVFKATAKDLLAQVQAEMARRAAQALRADLTE